MKRGEVWTVASGSGYSGKPRPAVVVQDEAFEGIDSVTVCMFTTTTVDTEIAGVADVRPGVTPSELNGLAESSQIMVDKITTLRVEKVGRRLGELSEADVQALDEALMGIPRAHASNPLVVDTAVHEAETPRNAFPPRCLRPFPLAESAPSSQHRRRH